MFHFKAIATATDKNIKPPKTISLVFRNKPFVLWKKLNSTKIAQKKNMFWVFLLHKFPFIDIPLRLLFSFVAIWIF
jgi:hypothetical protein